MADEKSCTTQVLLFNPGLLDWIRMGVKTQTIRAGVKSITPGLVDLQTVGREDDHFTGFVHTIEVIKFADISTDDARNEGYQTSEQLKHVLMDCYKKIFQPYELMTRIQFRKGNK